LPPSEPGAILDRLVAAQIRFVLVGGLAAVTQGAPIMTHDVGIVPARDDANIDALMALLVELHARYRRSGPPLAPRRELIAGTGHNSMVTDLGPLDVLGAIEGGRDYDALLLESIEIPFDGASVRVLSLESIVKYKRLSSHPKDKAVLPILEETLRQLGEKP
jgi:hypothetical protein